MQVNELNPCLALLLVFRLEPEFFIRAFNRNRELVSKDIEMVKIVVRLLTDVLRLAKRRTHKSRS